MTTLSFCLSLTFLFRVPTQINAADYVRAALLMHQSVLLLP